MRLKFLVLTTLVLQLLTVSIVSAVEVTVNGTFVYYSPVSVSVSQAMSLMLIRDASKSGHYTASDLGRGTTSVSGLDTTWNTKYFKQGKVMILGQTGLPLDITYPSTVTLTGGAYQATMTLKVYGKDSTFVTVPTDVAATVSTSGHIAVTPASGAYYMVIAPSDLLFTDDIPDLVWTGVAPITADYSL